MTTENKTSQPTEPAIAVEPVLCVRAENLYTPDCIRTYTGIYMNIFEPTLEMICIEDIAHALANQCRFAGHLPKFYSVAQHSILTAKTVYEGYRLQALLHDASEAYLLDIPSPIKKRLNGYKEIEDKLMLLIAEKFEFQYPLHEKVKEVDGYMLQWEWSTLMLKREIFPKLESWTPEFSKQQFLKMYAEICTVIA